MRGTSEQKIDLLKAIVQFKGYSVSRIGAIAGLTQKKYNSYFATFEANGLVKIKRNSQKRIVYPTPLCFETLRTWKKLLGLLDNR